jgi:hypothetical protein
VMAATGISVAAVEPGLAPLLVKSRELPILRPPETQLPNILTYDAA